jgi:hypothetical protein
MATARDVVSRALRLVGVAASDVPVDATDAANGLEALNSMLRGWEARGVYVGHDTDYTLNSTFETGLLPDRYRDPTTYLLAEALAIEYGRPLTMSLSKRISESWKTISANYLSPVNLDVDDGLKRMPSQRWGFWSGRR